MEKGWAVGRDTRYHQSQNTDQEIEDATWELLLQRSTTKKIKQNYNLVGQRLLQNPKVYWRTWNWRNSTHKYILSHTHKHATHIGADSPTWAASLGT